MERIPAKSRFSKNSKISEMSFELLRSAIAQFDLHPEECGIHPLTGGFMNANFLVTRKNQRFVFRIYSTDRATAERETDLLMLLKSHPVLAPSVFGIFETHGRPVSVLEYIDGITLEDRLLGVEVTDPHFYGAIGEQLAQIHSIRFEEAGFVGPKLKVGKEYGNFSIFIRQFIESTLSKLSEDRLSGECRKRVENLVHDKWHLVLGTEPSRQLVHSDFNPKNILVSRDAEPKLLAVIDWEFCLSGNGLIDLGNFFRFDYDYPLGAQEQFAKGYRSKNPDLAPNWRDVARLLDLGNMCSFLERQEDYKESFRTARVVIKSTLEHFGY